MGDVGSPDAPVDELPVQPVAWVVHSELPVYGVRFAPGGPVTAVPEPSTWAMLLGGVLLVAWWRRA